MVILADFQPYKYENLVRRGSIHDGGYLIPSDLGANLLISFGLGYDWKFELDLIRHKQVNEFVVFDHTISVSNLVKKLLFRKPKLNSYVFVFIVILRYLRDFILFRYAHVRKRISAIGGPENCDTLNVPQVFEVYASDPETTVFLKIDIEGAEYEIIDQIIFSSRQIKVLVIEFHDIQIRSEEFVKSMSELKSKFALIHTHVNNYGKVDTKGIPDICEFTFINLGLFEPTYKVNKLPITGLDSPTTPSRPDFETVF